jgi:hypothetical protein
MHKGIRFAGTAAVLAACISCGDVVRESRSPVLLVVTAVGDSTGKTPLNSDVDNFVNDAGQAVLQASMKDTLVSPTSNNLVTLSRYHVQFTRSDGRNVQGVDVPYAFDGALTASVVPGLSTTTVSFDIVRHAAKHEAPLTQIASGGTVITMLTTITFYGQDAVGNELAASGTISVNFGKFQ